MNDFIHSVKRFLVATFSLFVVFGATQAQAQLIGLNSGMQMTCQFVNNTAGQYADSQIYVIAICLNSSNQYCYLQSNGTLTPLVAGQNASSFFQPISAFTGMQFPTVMTSCRLYVALGAPLNIPINPGTPVGIVYPNIENPSDPNINAVFDWIEFNVGNNQIFCNTTQVDMFGIPMLMQMFDTTSGSSYALSGTVGLSEPTAQLMSEYTASVPTAFQSLVGAKRIVAPIHGSFGASGANAGYFDSYINSVWSQYTSSSLVITLNSGTYTGTVNGSNQLAFTKPGDPTTYYVNKPTTNDVWGGAGALASGNSVELALEAQICAAFHRHVIDNAANLNNPSAYYQSAPADYYSQFWHQHNLNAAAYGFCYDDVNNQSSSLIGNSPRGLILTIGGGAGGTLTPTPTPVPHSTWRVVTGGAAYTDSQSNVWAADENYSGGTVAAVSTNSISSALPGSGDQALYQSQRYGSPFNYVFNVPAGSYQVTMKFAETYWTAIGQRVFNVSINGVPVLSNFDVFKTAGAANKALDEVFNNISPLSGAISIQFGPASVDNAMIDAIQIIPMPATATNTPTQTATKSFTPTGTNTMTSTFTTVPNTATSTNTMTQTSTSTSVPNTATRTSTMTQTSTSTAVPNTVTNTQTSTNTAAHTSTPTMTSTNTVPNTSTPTMTYTSTVNQTTTAAGGHSTATFTASNTPVNTSTNTLTSTATALNTSTSTMTKTATAIHTATPTMTMTNTNTALNTSTSTMTFTRTNTPTNTFTFTASPTWTPTKTHTPVFTSTWTWTASATWTYTSTPVPPTSTPTTGAVCGGVPAWNGNFVAYTVGQKVSYNSEVYQCIQSHTSESNWMPPVVPALWKDMGACGATASETIVTQPVVYPNPATGATVHLALPQANMTNVTVKVSTVAFREVRTLNFPQVSGNNVEVALVDKAAIQLADGLYYFSIQANGQHWVVKVLVLR